MASNLTWGCYIVRRAGALCVAEKPDVCACMRNILASGEAAKVPYSVYGGDRCPDCHGTGLAWHWECRPTAGMLVAWIAPAREQWGVLTNDDLGIVGRPYLPLLPPANVAPLAELLALIADETHANGYPHGWCHIWHKTGGRGKSDGITEAFYNGNPPYFIPPSYGYTDTAPLELAIQRHKALAAYIAGWGAR